MKVHVRIDDEKVRQAFRQAPRSMEQALAGGVRRAAREVANEARQRAPKAHSVLTNSIRVLRGARSTEAVVAPGVQYARYVEEGTGRFGPRGLSPGRRQLSDQGIQNLVDWIRVKRLVPDDPNMDEEDLAWLIGRTIARRGTVPQPFLEPALEASRSRIGRIIRQAVTEGVRRAGLA